MLSLTEKPEGRISVELSEPRLVSFWNYANGRGAKRGKRALVKGPTILPESISFCNLDMTKSGFCRALFRLGDSNGARLQ